MLFTQAEVTTLRLIGWCKDVPADIADSFQGVYTFSKECIGELTQLKLVYAVKETGSLRLTPAGYHLLEAAGIPCPADKSYEGRENIILRRHMAARVCVTMLMAGIDVFTGDVPSLSGGGFLSTATLRREKKKNIAGSTKLLGLCNTDAGAFKVYYPDDSRLYYGSEQSISNNLLSRIGKSQGHAVLYAGTDYLSLCAAMTEKTGQRSNGPITYRQAYDKLSAPVHLLPCNADGAFQLRVMTQAGYRRKLTDALFDGDEHALPDPLHSDCDGIWKGAPLILGVDMDLKRIDRVLRDAGAGIVYLFILQSQADAYTAHYGEVENIRYYLVNNENVLRLFGFDTLLAEPGNGAFVTEDKRLIDTRTLRRIREAHKPGRRRREVNDDDAEATLE